MCYYYLYVHILSEQTLSSRRFNWKHKYYGYQLYFSLVFQQNFPLHQLYCSKNFNLFIINYSEFNLFVINYSEKVLFYSFSRDMQFQFERIYNENHIPVVSRAFNIFQTRLLFEAIIETLIILTIFDINFLGD